MKTYPVCLIGLDRRPSTVVGGGNVALRKVTALLEAGARVTVISPTLINSLQAMVDNGQIDYLPRQYKYGDLGTVHLVIAATDDPEVNRSVWEEAKQRDCLINVVDDPSHSNFILPAVVRRGDLTIAISTGGASPALARRLRQSLEEMFAADYGDFIETLAEIRPEILNNYPPGDERLQAALDLIDSELLSILRKHGKEQALTYARQRLQVGQENAFK
jgi:precorrin-2 dehydrogenase/sirohydrochlorin ferrochelatase